MSTRLPASRDRSDPDLTGSSPEGQLRLPAGSGSTTEGPTPEGLHERIRCATAAGGLYTLPDRFDQTDGDWQIIKHDDPFTLLYLDGAQHERITVEVVERHYRLIRAFWDDKIQAIRQGNQRMVVRFGGPTANSALIDEYSRKLDAAFALLSQLGGIHLTWSKAEETRIAELRNKGRTDIGLVLDGMLADGVFDPQDWAVLCRRGLEYSLAEDDVAALVAPALDAAQMVPIRPPCGTTGAARISSTTWARPDKLAQMTSSLATPLPAPRKEGAGAGMVLVLAVVVLSVAGTGWYLLTDRPATAQDAPSRVSEITTASREETYPPNGPAAAIQEETSTPAIVRPAIETVTTAPVMQKDAVRATEDPKEVARRQRVQEARLNVTSLMDGIERAVGEWNLDSARNGVVGAEAIVRQFPGELGPEILRLSDLRKQVDDAFVELQRIDAERGAEKKRIEAEQAAVRLQWERRIKEIEEALAADENMTANNLAKALLKIQSLPADVAERARALSDEARSRLEKGLDFEVGRAKTKRKQ